MPDAPTEQNPAPTPPAPSTETPPWGEDFDAAKAFALIQNLRTDKTKLSEKVSEFETAAQAAVDEKKTAEQKLNDRATKAEQDLAAAQRAVYIERALRKHAVPDDLADFLTGDTEEEIEQKAERLSKVGKPTDEEEPQPSNDGRPTPKLTPGHGGAPAEPFNAAEVAKTIRGRRY